MLYATTCVLTGCNNVLRQRDQAIHAAERFRALYNNACQEIYDSASRNFRRHEMPGRWLRDCVELHQRLGYWRQFTPKTSNGWPIGEVGIVWIRGPARFDLGPADVRLDWDLADGHAALYNLLIEPGGEQISIPGFSGEVRGE